jgi:hypothetical protein
MSKDFSIEFLIDGKNVGSSTITIVGKTLLTDAAEDEFFAILRKNEKSLLEEAEGEEKSHIVDTLTTLQEDVLKEAHAKDYIGLDDDMPDAYEAWLEDLSLGELKDLLK